MHAGRMSEQASRGYIAGRWCRRQSILEPSDISTVFDRYNSASCSRPVLCLVEGREPSLLCCLGHGHGLPPSTYETTGANEVGALGETRVWGYDHGHRLSPFLEHIKYRHIGIFSVLLLYLLVVTFER